MQGGDTTEGSDPRDARRFRTTHWSVVLATGDNDPQKRAEALENLCGAYWYPLYAFVRRKGFSPHDAEDLTQAFFAHLLEKQLYNDADRVQGRFRSYLLRCAENFLRNEWRHRTAQKRGGHKQVVSLDATDAEERYLIEPVDPTTPEVLYERVWATTVLERTLARLRDVNVKEGHRDRYERLRVFLQGGDDAPSYAEAAAELQMSLGAVKSFIYRLRQQFREFFHDELAHTVTTSADLEEEMRHLLSRLTG